MCGSYHFFATLVFILYINTHRRTHTYKHINVSISNSEANFCYANICHLMLTYL